MTKEDVGTEQAEDATARLGMRSLLKPFPVARPGRCVACHVLPSFHV